MHASNEPSRSALAPFRVRSFRFQWPADLATSWAFEMETLILGWYVLVETRSVLMLTVFASLQHVGTLIAPMFGVMGDRIGHRKLLCAMRSVYAVLATVLMVLALTDVLTPTFVLIVAAIAGMVRPSDIGVCAALAGATLPGTQLVGAMGIQRTTMDSARIAGALSGVGMVAALGMGVAYAAVAALYAVSVLLTSKTDAGAPRRSVAAPTSPWRDLREGLAYVRRTPPILAVMCLAFLLNLTAFPHMSGLLPYVAKEVYGADQTWLGYMAACAAAGALFGSLVLTRYGAAIRPARVMIVFCFAWYAMLVAFAHQPDPVVAIVVLGFAGCAQSMSQIPMSAMLLRTSEEALRGRVMGIRMLAIYGHMQGLLLAGPLIAAVGYPAATTAYCVFGAIFTGLIVARWRAHLWRADAPSNRR